MAGYIYLPVATDEMLEFAHVWQAGQREKGKVPYAVLCNFEKGWLKGIARSAKKGVLRDVNNTDKLYILAHGSALGSAVIGVKRGRKRSTDIGGWTGGTYKKYTAVELAEVLESEGLRKSFIDLRVFACGSSVTPAQGATVSFAMALKTALLARGYAAIMVTGYNGATKTSYGQRRIPGTVDQYTADKHKGVLIGSEIMPASTQKITF